MVVLLRCFLQFTNGPAKGLDLIPVGKIDVRIKRGGAFGHPHDKADHGPVPEPVFRIVDLATENSDDGRLPGYVSKEFPDVGISVWLLLFLFPCHSIDREKRAMLRLDRRNIIFDEPSYLWSVFTVANAGPYDDLVEGPQVDPGSWRQFK